MIASNRREMGQFLEERMTRSYTDLSERQELEPDTALVKTYVVEAHSSQDPDAAKDLWRTALQDDYLRVKYEASIHTSEERTLLTIDGTFDGGEPVSIFVDLAPKRFWILHTLARSRAIDWILKRTVKLGPALDQAWIPAQVLEELSHLGSFRGLGLDFDRRLIGDIDSEDQSAPLEFLKMQLWGNRARKVLELLRSEGAFPDSTTLSKIKLKFWPDSRNMEQFTLDDIKYDGKLTARGTSFTSHLGIVDFLISAYRGRIEQIENTYPISRLIEQGGLVVHGEPLFFTFSRPITQPDRFCKAVFSSSEPFRLWGTPLRVSKGMIRVRAVDLHVGSRIDFEITRDFIRVFLPEGTCGNSVMRFYTLLQHYYDSKVQLTDGDGTNVF